MCEGETIRSESDLQADIGATVRALATHAQVSVVSDVMPELDQMVPVASLAALSTCGRHCCVGIDQKMTFSLPLHLYYSSL